MCIVHARADEGKVELPVEFPLVYPNRNLLAEGLEMQGKEREEYAGHLTQFAVKMIKTKKEDEKAVAQARKALIVALNLSPRNKEAVVSNIQLSKGVIPKVAEPVYEKETLSTLLYVRGKNLRKAEGEVNYFLGRVFIQMAAEFNIRNVDAVYDAEILTQDEGELNWGKMLAQ